MAIDITKLSRQNALDVMGVTEKSSPDEVKDAYKRLARACHPDNTGSTYLFQLINNAYMLLQKADEVKNQPQATKSTENKAKANPSMSDLFYEKDFLCPFKTFMMALELGKAGFVFKKYSIHLTPNIIDMDFVRTEWPVRVEFKGYKNILAYLFDKPTVTRTKNTGIQNAWPYSRKFVATFNIDTDKGRIKYHRLTTKFDLLDIEMHDRGRSRNKPAEITKVQEYNVTTPVKLQIKLNLKFK